MTNGLEKKLFGGSVTVLLVVLYFEIRDLRLQIKSLERRLDQHITYHNDNDCEVQFTSD